MSHIEPLVRQTLPGCLGMRRALNLLLFWWVATALSGELSQRGGCEKNHGAEDDRENVYQFHSQSLPLSANIFTTMPSRGKFSIHVRRTPPFTCRAGCKERGVSENRNAGPVSATSWFGHTTSP